MQRAINQPTDSPQPTNHLCRHSDVNNLAWTTGGLLEPVKWCATTNHTLINGFRYLKREMEAEMENNFLHDVSLAGFGSITICLSDLLSDTDLIFGALIMVLLLLVVKAVTPCSWENDPESLTHFLFFKTDTSAILSKLDSLAFCCLKFVSK